MLVLSYCCVMKLAVRGRQVGTAWAATTCCVLSSTSCVPKPHSPTPLDPPSQPPLSHTPPSLPPPPLPHTPCPRQALYRGNGANVARLIPDVAFKFAVHDQFKMMFAPQDGSPPGVQEKMAAGAATGVLASTGVGRTLMTLAQTHRVEAGVYREAKVCVRPNQTDSPVSLSHRCGYPRSLHSTCTLISHPLLHCTLFLRHLAPPLIALNTHTLRPSPCPPSPPQNTQASCAR
jgi:hypothetical protein